MNVIWVVSDTLRRDHVGAYGNKTIRTPSMDDFAGKSIQFNRHYIAGFPTMPTRADHLTGRWTMSYMQWEPLPENDVTLPQILKDGGYRTTAVVDTPFYLRRGMNYDRGFLTFIDIPGQTHYEEHVGEPFEDGDVRRLQRLEADMFAPRTFTKAMEWLEYHYKEDFFLYVDTWDPHEPWDAPNYYTELYWPGYDGEKVEPCYGYWQDTPDLTEEKVKKAHAAYCGEVTMVDTWFGYFMKRVENMGLLKNTAILFTSDHGFYFGEHGGLFGKMVFAKDENGVPMNGIWTHSQFYEEVAAIPLFIYVPGIAPATYDGLTSAVDLMPTVLDIMGKKIPSRVEGKSLLPMIKDQTIPGRDYVVSAHPFINAGDKLRSVDDIERTIEKHSTATVTTKEWSLLYVVEPGLSELYHLPSDPGQTKNLIEEKPEIARELHQMLIHYMKETNIDDHILNQRLELRI